MHPSTASPSRSRSAFQKAAAKHKLKLHICKCKNSDMEDIEELVPSCDGCQIAGPQSACHGKGA